MTHNDKQDVISVCNILADKMSDSGQVAVQQIIGAVEDMVENEPCEDAISRAEALRHSHIEYDDDGEGHRVVYVEDIEELPSVTPKTVTDFADKCKECGKILNDKLQTRWIPCSERLPEKHGCYETTVKIDIPDLKPYYETRVAQFDGKDFDIGYIGDGFSVIAWKLPSEPYREEQDVKTIQIMIDKRGCVTNGDVIKNMFPNIIYEEGYVFIESDTHTKVIMTVQEDWWNAPYKAETEKGKRYGTV